MKRETSDADTPGPGAPSPARAGGRASRWLLFLPFVALVLVAAGWSAFWFVARGQVEEGLERFVAEQGLRGSRFECEDRRLGGFPFRIELRCQRLVVTRASGAGPVVTETGPFVAVAQTHRPGHVIVQAQGPLAVRFPDGRRLEARWEALEASYRQGRAGPERLSMLARRLSVTGSGPAQPTLTASAQQVEAHARPRPVTGGAAPSATGAMELNISAAQIASGELDALFGDTNPALLELAVATTEAQVFAGGLSTVALEAWRQSGARLEVQRVALTKGLKRMEARGELGLDVARRIEGRLEAAVANIDQIGGMRINAGALDLAAALSGRAVGQDGLKPLPALVAREGRLSLGPIRLPVPPLQPLYGP